MKCITLILLMVVLLLPIGLSAQVGPDMRIMFGGNFSLQSMGGGGELSLLVPISGTNFFVIGQAEANDASSGFDDDGYGKQYGLTGMLGYGYTTDRWMFAITGGIVDQWYKFLQLTDPTLPDVADQDNYVQSTLSALVFWRLGDEYEIFVQGDYWNPIKENRLSSEFGVAIGLAVPFGT